MSIDSEVMNRALAEIGHFLGINVKVIVSETSEEEREILYDMWSTEPIKVHHWAYGKFTEREDLAYEWA